MIRRFEIARRARRARRALTALMFCVAAAPLVAQTAPTRPTTLVFDSVNAVIAALIPAKDRANVKNVKLSAQGKDLRVDADVRMSAVPGMEMMSALGFAHVTGVGPVNLIKPGQAGWLIRSIEVAGASISPSLWAPLVRKGTKRNDNYIVVPVGEWVKGVEVQPGGLRLY